MYEKKGRKKANPSPVANETSSQPATPAKNQKKHELTEAQKEQYQTKLDLIVLCVNISKKVPQKYPALVVLHYQLHQILNLHNVETNKQVINGFEKEIYAIAGANIVNLTISRTDDFKSNHIKSRRMLLQEQADNVLQNWLPLIKQPIAALRQALHQPAFPSKDWFRSKLAVFGLTSYKAEVVCLDDLTNQLDKIQNSQLDGYEKLDHIHNSIRKATFSLEKLDAPKDVINKLQQHLPALPKIDLSMKKEEIQPEPQVNEIVHSAPIPSLDLRWKNKESAEEKDEPKHTVSSSPSQ